MKRVWRYLENSLFAIYLWLVDLFTFNSEIESMVDALNHKLEEPPTKLAIKNFSHPGGFVRELSKRRLSIAAAYIKIARDLSPENVEERLIALRILVEQSLHAKTINMPLNTARVQIEMMKEAVKSRHDKRRQMECMADFGLASFGQEAVIRDFLNQRNLVEVPEEDLPLKDLKMGWDDHVHDTLSEGRKTPTQVLLDAFVKGLSELSLVYSHIDERRMIHEAMAAGNLLGIKVNIGVEFSVGKSGSRRHYMYVPPDVADSKAFFAFFDERKAVFTPFHEGLRNNAINRRKTMAAAIERFNTFQRVKLNQGYEPDSPCWIPPLKIEELDKIVACGQVSRAHLAELLYQKLHDHFHRRVLYLKAQVLAARVRFSRGIYSEWELKNINLQYETVREQFENMNPEALKIQYIDSRDVMDYDSVFESEEAILTLLAGQGGKIAVIHPLEMGLKEAMIHILKYAHLITHVETYNLADSVNRNPNDLTVFNKLLYILNNRPIDDLVAFFEQHGLTGEGVDRRLMEKAKASVANRSLVPVCGSDSTGRDPTIPGMGFIKTSSISEKCIEKFKENHFRIPRPIADMIVHQGKKDPDSPIDTEKADIICMGKIGKPFRNRVGDESQVELPGFFTFGRYLNPSIKEMLRTLAGFAVAYHWIGPKFALIWFGITSIRNMLVDLIASSGFNFKSWRPGNINFDNISQSLFWTGFSVPILNTVKNNFDLFWTWDKVGWAFEITKFFFICLANGLYISNHNRLRNFDRRVIGANFFRSVLAWPFATLFHGIGDSLNILAIVQAKFWSDFVGGLIEGSGKYRQRFIIRKRDLNELLPRIDSHERETRLTAMLDILYIWAMQPRGITCLDELLTQQFPFWERFRRGRPDPEQVKKDQELYWGYHEKLLNLFGDPGCMNILSEFVLKNYHDREVVYLTDLIGYHCESFLSWMRQTKKRRTGTA